MVINAAKTSNTENYFYDSVRDVFESGASHYSEAFGAWLQNNADTMITVDAGLTAQELDVVFAGVFPI